MCVRLCGWVDGWVLGACLCVGREGYSLSWCPLWHFLVHFVLLKMGLHLQSAHVQDLKSANVLLTTEGRAKIADVVRLLKHCEYA